MVATKGQAIGLAVVSILTLGAGIAVMVLFHAMFTALVVSGQTLPALSIFWPYGLPVLVVGVLGLVAAAVRNNIGIGIYMAICIVCLVVEGVFVVIFGLLLFVLLSVEVSGNCMEIQGTCTCDTSVLGTSLLRNSVTTGADCVDPRLNSLNLSRAACAMIIVSWLLMLVGSIVSCMACCCGKRQPGTVIIAHGTEMK